MNNGSDHQLTAVDSEVSCLVERVREQAGMEGKFELKIEGVAGRPTAVTWIWVNKLTREAEDIAERMRQQVGGLGTFSKNCYYGEPSTVSARWTFRFDVK